MHLTTSCCCTSRGTTRRVRGPRSRTARARLHGATPPKETRQVWVGLCCRGTHLFAVATVSRYQTGSMLFRYTNPLGNALINKVSSRCFAPRRDTTGRGTMGRLHAVWLLFWVLLFFVGKMW